MTSIGHNEEVVLLGQVLAIMKIMPEDATIPLEELKKRIEQALQGKVDIEGFEEVPIFGPLSALRMRFIVEDEAGGTDSVEKIVKDIQGVGDIVIEAVSLL
jgi:translation elongation factor aEF-1 beta